MNRNKNFWNLIILFITSFIISGIGLFYGVAKSKTIPSNELIVNVLPLKAQSIDITNQYIGYVVPIKSVELVPNVSGYIDEVWAEGGQTVSAGDNLVLIDQKEYKAQLDAASASVIQAKADYNNAKTYYNRMQKAGKAVSASALDDAKAKYLASDASLKKAQSDEQKAKVLYDYTVLQSPIDGIIGNVNLTKGNYVAPGNDPLLSIIQFDPIRVVFAISDKDYLSQINQNPNGNLFYDEEIKLKLANGEIYPLIGEFKFTDNQINKSTNSISVYADFENKNKKLIANSYVDVLLSKKLKDVFLIRQNLAILKDNGAFITVWKKNKLIERPLDIVGIYKDYYVTANKFENDEFIVVDKIGHITPETKLKMNIINSVEDK
jgi:RND family efflux transporter MFP subunit